MKRLWTICACLARWGVGDELWIDGSFLTEKIDPNDVDLVLVIGEGFEERATPEQMAIWEWWEDYTDDGDPMESFTCHTFVVAKLQPGHPHYAIYLEEDLKWKKFFGTSRDGEEKGIGRILLPGGCV